MRGGGGSVSASVFLPVSLAAAPGNLAGPRVTASWAPTSGSRKRIGFPGEQRRERPLSARRVGRTPRPLAGPGFVRPGTGQ